MEELEEDLLHDGSLDIPVEHLDYSYVRRCDNIEELRNIVKILKLGKHGLYPHLVQFTEERIKTLNPNERPTLAYMEDLPKPEQDLIQAEIQDWMTQVKLDEERMSRGAQRLPEYPPIRGIGNTIQSEEVRKREKEDAYISMSQSERRRAASRERLKGNECMRGSQYQDAVYHYTTSIEINRNTLSINNRAQAYIKLKQWGNAVDDCSEVLTEEPQNMKAYYRRGRAYQHIGQYIQAVKDFEQVIRLDPENETAKKALAETLKLKEKEEKKGTRIHIEETGVPQGARSRGSSTKTVSDKVVASEQRKPSACMLLTGNSSNEESDQEEECSSLSAMEHLKNIRNSRKPALHPRSLLIQELDREESVVIDA